MKQKKKTYRKYTDALAEFLQIVHSDYAPGARLPVAAVMTKRLGISRETYTKILAIAAKSCHVIRNGHQRIRIPRYRERKIGFFFGYSGSSLMIAYPEMAANLISVFHKNGISMEVLNELNGATLHEHNISAVITFSPCDFSDAKTRKMLKDNCLKYGVPVIRIGGTDQNIRTPVPLLYSVYQNYDYALLELTQFLQEKKYRKTMLLQTGFRIPEELLRRKFIIQPEFPGLRKTESATPYWNTLFREKPDCILFARLNGHSAAILAELNKTVSESWNPDLYLNTAECWIGVRETYPNLHFRGGMEMNCRITAVVTTAMLDHYFRENRSLQTIGVNNFTIREFKDDSGIEMSDER